jgi:hypothetical protein
MNDEISCWHLVTYSQKVIQNAFNRCGSGVLGVARGVEKFEIDLWKR